MAATIADHPTMSPCSTVRIVTMPRSGTSVRRATRPLMTTHTASVSWPSRTTSAPGGSSRMTPIDASRAIASGDSPVPNQDELRAAIRSGGGSAVVVDMEVRPRLA